MPEQPDETAKFIPSELEIAEAADAIRQRHYREMRANSGRPHGSRRWAPNNVKVPHKTRPLYGD